MPISPRPRGRRSAALLALCATMALGACDRGPEQLLLARAAGHELTVEETVRLIRSAPRIPADSSVVEAVGNLWVDYTLLAEAVAEDTTLAHLDVTPLVDQRTEAEMILALWDSLVVPDTTVTEAELEAWYAEQGAGEEVVASHILVAFPQGGATPAQRDSVRARAEEIRRRAVAGEDFAELARQFSQDPGTSRRGGDVGRFSRGEMVRPFEEAAFALEEGEISEPVETPYGYHVIQLRERFVPGLDQVRDRPAPYRGRRVRLRGGAHGRGRGPGRGERARAGPPDGTEPPHDPPGPGRRAHGGGVRRRRGHGGRGPGPHAHPAAFVQGAGRAAPRFDSRELGDPGARSEGGAPPPGP